MSLPRPGSIAPAVMTRKCELVSENRRCPALASATGILILRFSSIHLTRANRTFASSSRWETTTALTYFSRMQADRNSAPMRDEKPRLRGLRIMSHWVRAPQYSCCSGRKINGTDCWLSPWMILNDDWMNKLLSALMRANIAAGSSACWIFGMIGVENYPLDVGPCLSVDRVNRIAAAAVFVEVARKR